MSRFDFVFSNRPICRVSRHVAFWLIFSLYILTFRYYLYDIKYLSIPSTYLIRLHNLLLFLPLSIFFAYLSLYVLLPQYIVKSKYKQLFLIVLLLSVVSVTISFQISTHFDILLAWDVPLIRSTLVRQLDFTVSNGLVYPLTVSAFATCIKMGKGLYFKQKDNEWLIQLKIKSELQLLKSQIHPRFLFHSLNSIHKEITEGGAAQSPTIILQLSDLLSYILYESDADWVPLEKELNMIHDYMAIETVGYDKRLTTSFEHTLTDTGKLIAPLILLPLVESVFELASLLKNKNPITVAVEVTLKEADFTFLLRANGFDSACMEHFQKNERLFPVHKRLEGLYADKHELKTNFDKEKLVIFLSLGLDTYV